MAIELQIENQTISLLVKTDLDTVPTGDKPISEECYLITCFFSVFATISMLLICHFAYSKSQHPSDSLSNLPKSQALGQCFLLWFLLKENKLTI